MFALPITILKLLYVLFLPGFVLSFVFFSRRHIDFLERIALSIALSIAVVPLVVFYANLMGIKITQPAVIAEIFLILVLTGGILLFKRSRVHKI